jgi:hypothetical protein
MPSLARLRAPSDPRLQPLQALPLLAARVRSSGLPTLVPPPPLHARRPVRSLRVVVVSHPTPLLVAVLAHIGVPWCTGPLRLRLHPPCTLCLTDAAVGEVWGRWSCLGGDSEGRFRLHDTDLGVRPEMMQWCPWWVSWWVWIPSQTRW